MSLKKTNNNYQSPKDNVLFISDYLTKSVNKDAGCGITNDPRHASKYIADMTYSLHNVAIDAGLPFVAYLLEMAFHESNNILCQFGEETNSFD